MGEKLRTILGSLESAIENVFRTGDELDLTRRLFSQKPTGKSSREQLPIGPTASPITETDSPEDEKDDPTGLKGQMHDMLETIGEKAGLIFHLPRAEEENTDHQKAA